MTGRELGYTWSRYIKAGADKAQQNGSDSSFTVNMGQSLQAVQKVAIMNVIFRHNFYNVLGDTDDQNNTFTIVRLSDSASELVTIPPGWYNVITLSTAIQNAINSFLAGVSNPDTVAITQDPTNYYVTSTLTNGSHAGTHGFTMSGSVISLLGYVSQPVTVTTTATADKLPSLGGITEVYLLSRSLAPGNSMDEDGDYSNVLLPIPITVPFGQLQVFECKQEVLCNIQYPRPRNLQEIDFTLADRDLHPLNLQGANLKIDLKVWMNIL